MKTKAKIITLLLSLVAAFALCFAFAGCNDDGNTGTGDKGNTENKGDSKDKGNSEAHPEWELYAGVYKFESLTTITSMTMGGQTYDNTVVIKKDEDFGGVTYRENYMVVTLNSDGTGTLTSDVSDMGDTSVSTPFEESEATFNWYVEEENTLKTTANGQTVATYQIEDDCIYFELVVNNAYGSTIMKFELKKAS